MLQFEPGIGFSTVTSLSITGGTLDMTNNGLYIDFGSATDPISQIVGYLQTGYSAGAWTGPGIDSSSAAANPSYALGYADGIDGVVAGLSPGQIEIAYTLYGDANLDGTVNAEDYTQFAENIGQSGRNWDQGDFNYDQTVNAEDYTLYSQNIGQSATESALFGTLVPAANFSENSTLSSTPSATTTKSTAKTSTKTPAANVSTPRPAPHHPAKKNSR
jgi:hypothetical protein